MKKIKFILMAGMFVFSVISCENPANSGDSTTTTPSIVGTGWESSTTGGNGSFIFTSTTTCKTGGTSYPCSVTGTAVIIRDFQIFDLDWTDNQLDVTLGTTHFIKESEPLNVLFATSWVDSNKGNFSVRFKSNTKYMATSFGGGGEYKGTYTINGNEVTFTGGYLNGQTENFNDDDDSDGIKDIAVDLPTLGTYYFDKK